MNRLVRLTVLGWLLGVLCSGSNAKSGVARPGENGYVPLTDRLRIRSRVKWSRVEA